MRILSIVYVNEILCEQNKYVTGIAEIRNIYSTRADIYEEYIWFSSAQQGIYFSHVFSRSRLNSVNKISLRKKLHNFEQLQNKRESKGSTKEIFILEERLVASFTRFLLHSDESFRDKSLFPKKYLTKYFLVGNWASDA